jgi:hypothetical protein
MSEENKPRTIPEIQQEYQSHCLRAGDIQYRITQYQSDLDLVNNRLRDLNIEAAQIKAKETEDAKESENVSQG